MANKEQKIRIAESVNTELKSIKELVNTKNGSETILYLIEFYKSNYVTCITKSITQI